MQLNHSDGTVSAGAVVQIMDSVGKNRGGLTRAAFERFRHLAEGRRAVLVTVAFQPQVRQVFQELVEDGSLPSHAELLNYYEDQRAQVRPDVRPVGAPHTWWESGGRVSAAPEPANTGTFVRYFDEGSFVGLVSRDGNGLLRMVEKHDENRPWVREYRDSPWGDGSIAKREYYDDENRPRFRIYIDSDMKPYLSVWVNENGYEHRAAEHTGATSSMRGDTRGANAAWLKGKLAGIGPSVVYTDEPRTTFALTVAGPGIRHVTTVHTTHYNNNRDDSEGLKHWSTHYERNFDRIDSLVFFTDAQRQDFIRDTGCPGEKTVVIPHAAPLESAAAMVPVDRHLQRLVAVSRLADDKRLDDAIRAFAIAASSLPGAEFKIYGTGASKEPLKRLISDLDAGAIITLEGQTDAPLECFAAGAASVMTSRYEGFGLVITESFAVGTPVISYDVIYGPRAIVKDGMNGCLCPDGDIDGLASAIVRTLQDPAEMARLQAGALETASQYSRQQWAEGWAATLSDSPVTVRVAHG